MTEYNTPKNISDGAFITASYWNSQFGENGSIMFLYKKYTENTRGYHLKISKSDFDSMSTSWVMSSEDSNLVTWNTAIIDEYPDDSVSMWDDENGNYSQIVIQKSGFYFIHAHLNIFNYSISNQAIYAHIIVDKGEFNIQTIATNVYLSTLSNSLLGSPTWANRQYIRPINVQTVYYLEAEDILYVKLQSDALTLGTPTLSFISKNYYPMPTEYTSNYAKGTPEYVSNGTLTSFVATPYLGNSPSFFEVQSIRLDT